MQLTPWQRLRTGAYLFAVALKRRMTLGAQVVAVDGNRVLLVRQTYMPGWHLPGGGVEPGETAEAAAAREMEEESGWRPAGDLTLFGLYHNVSAATNRDHVALFVCRRSVSIRPFRPGREIAEAAWFPLDALPDPVTPGAMRRIGEVVRGTPQSRTW